MLLSLIGYDDPMIVLLTSLSVLLYHYSVSNANVIMSGQYFCYEGYNVCCAKLCIGHCELHCNFFSLYNLNSKYLSNQWNIAEMMFVTSKIRSEKTLKLLSSSLLDHSLWGKPATTS